MYNVLSMASFPTLIYLKIHIFFVKIEFFTPFKILISNILFFSYNVFKRLPSQGYMYQTMELKGKGLKLYSLTHYQTIILDSSKLKEFADNDFKFDENGRKLSKQVENTVGKGEIARY